MSTNQTNIHPRDCNRIQDMNVDCGCIIFQYLSTPAAILLSRTSHFWYEISQRRAAYPPVKFPSFQEEFDILEYRQWQEFGRQRTSLTPLQLLRCSTSRVWQSRLNDLELRLECPPNCFCVVENGRSQDPSKRIADQSKTTPPLQPGAFITPEEVKQATSRYRNIQALTITIQHRCESVDETGVQYLSWYSPFDTNPPELFHQRVVAHLIPHVASTLVSFQLSLPTNLNFVQHGRIKIAWLGEIDPSLKFPNLVHSVLPCGGPKDEEWTALYQYGPRGGVLELLRPFYSSYWSQQSHWTGPELMTQFLSLIGSPRHLLFHDETCGRWPPSPDVTCSQAIALPHLSHAQQHEIPPTHLSDMIPPGSALQEVNLVLPFQEAVFYLLPLTRVAHSLAHLRIRTRRIWTNSAYEFHSLLQQLYQQLHNGGVASDEKSKDASESSPAIHGPHDAGHLKSPFRHLQILSLGFNEQAQMNSFNWSPIVIDYLVELFPSLNTLRLFGQICLPYQLVGSLAQSSLVQLRHLTTVIPNVAYHGSGDDRTLAHNYVKRIILELRQLESLHFVLPQELFQRHYMDVFDIVMYSSSNLTQLTFSQKRQSWSHWCFTDKPIERVTLNQFLIRLHILWHVLQPTHLLPIESMTLAPTCMIDLLPLLLTLLRHPSSELPYLRTACREFDSRRDPNQKNGSSSVSSPSLGQRVRNWFRSEADVQARQEAKLARQHDSHRSYLASTTQELETKMAMEMQLEATPMVESSGSGSGDGQIAWKIHTRPQFRIILQLERD